MKRKYLNELISVLNYVAYSKDVVINNMTVKNLVNRPVDFDFFKEYRGLVKDIIYNIELDFDGAPWHVSMNGEPGRVSYEKMDLSKRIFVNKEFFDIPGGCLKNVVLIEMNKLYPRLYVNAFKSGRLTIDEPGVLELMQVFDDNRDYIKEHATSDARKVMNVIENSFYGILTTKRNDGFKVYPNTPDFLSEFYNTLHSLVDMSKIAYLNTCTMAIPLRYYDELKEPLFKVLESYNIKYTAEPKHILCNEIPRSTKKQAGIKI